MKPFGALILSPGLRVRCALACATPLVSLVLLVACGGGQLAGVGSGGSGLAQGSVSGFGSVIVDGVEYDNSTVTAQQAGADGQLSGVDLKLGQQIRMVYALPDASTTVATARSILVLPQLRGPVSMAMDRNGWLQVMGQWVRVVRSNDDISRLGATRLSGYGGISDIAVNDEVLVHGAWAWDSSKSAYVLVATLVDKTTPGEQVLLGGVVQGFDGRQDNRQDGRQLRLNASTGTVIQAATLPDGLANGQSVQAWLPRVAMATALASGQAITVSQLSSDALALASTLSGQQQATLSGQATAYDSPTRRVQVQGVWVQLGGNVDIDTDALTRGEFVSLTLQAATPGQAPTASQAALRPPPGGATDLGASAVLKGSVSGVDWTAAVVTFTLRSTKVQAGASAVGSSCAAVARTATVNVQVIGAFVTASDVVTASSVTCNTPASVPPTAH